MTFEEMFPVYSSYLVAVFITIVVIFVSICLIFLLICAIRAFIDFFKSNER